MSQQLWDSVVETSTTTGTGDFTLAGPVVGYQSFDAVLNVSDTCYYLIEAIDGSGDRTGEWEIGLGTYSATDTITRTQYIDGSNYPSATSFSAGTKRVSMVLAALAAKFRGALVYKGSDETTANYTTAAAMTFNSESYDTDAIHDTGSNTSRLTVPAGVTKVRLCGHARVTNFTASKYAALYLYKNGSDVTYAGQTGSITLNDLTVAEIAISSPVLAVVAGDYFELVLEVETDTSITVVANRTWFSMEIVE